MDEQGTPVKTQKQETHVRWKQGKATWDKYRDVVRVCRSAKGKVKAQAHLELNLAKDVKDSKKGFFKYISNKRNTRELVDLLLNGKGTLATWVTEKAELLNTFASVFTAKAISQESLIQETREKVWRQGRLSLG
ncbi:hypothetical protein HGM15179_019964 [Zosterops borbonicus]|uniref:Uncharacterized protein n=1 Tax=Zosterops borbonicus TaxID=364589 RepID=A0A8K1D7S6_9PASS|nr:hypothetical protein HGM15179_019964 [Zosterops borbonicus]